MNFTYFIDILHVDVNEATSISRAPARQPTNKQ